MEEVQVVLWKLPDSMTLYRLPNMDTALILKTPLGVISGKSAPQTSNEKREGSRLIRKDIPKRSISPIHLSESSSSVRCQPYMKMETEVFLFLSLTIVLLLLLVHAYGTK